jgi:carbamoyltransferase
MKVLGISAFYHDSAAALLIDGRIVAAAQEERFSRKKHDADFPRRATAYCLKAGHIKLAELDSIVFYEKPIRRLDRLLKTYLMYAPSGYSSYRIAAPLWVRGKMFHKKLLAAALSEFDSGRSWIDKLLFAEHHFSHAASAFFASPFDEALVLTMDGVGEWATTSVAHGSGNQLRILKEIHFPHSLGLLYSAFTDYLGFKVNSGEYKLMGLAPYGEPKYANKILDSLIDVKPDGSFRLNMDYFDYCVGLTMTNDRFHQLFGMVPRRAPESLTQEYMDVAASIQVVLEEVILRMSRAMAAEMCVANLCMAGGVALNCVAAGKVVRDGRFRKVWIQPASGDAGGALGAALAAFYSFHNRPRDACTAADGMQGSYLGPEFSQKDIESRLAAVGARFITMCDDRLIREAAKALVRGKILGWFQGRMEFGPRSLGARSILGDARSPCMQTLLNLKVKYRESFRPFAPSVLRERVSDYFELDTDSPYMLLVAKIIERRRLEMTEAEGKLFGIAKLNILRSDIPAVTHVDYSARVQTVHRETNPRYHALISVFEQLTGCAVLVNTSFNVRGEPIVCTPEDAFRCFMGTQIDTLAIGNCLLDRENQDISLRTNCGSMFPPD